jgi:hypothetical protein
MDSTQIVKHIVDTISIITNKPLQVVDATKKGINYWTVVPTVVAILSISFIIYDRLKKSKVYGKVLSITATFKSTFEYTGYDRAKKVIKGLTFTIKISIGAYIKDLYYNDVEVFANFPDNKRYKGVIFFARNETLNMDGKKYKLTVPPSQYLTYNNFIEKNKVQFFYLKFIIPDKFDDEVFESLDLDFIIPNQKKKVVHLNLIDERQTFFDEELCTPL